MGRWCTTRQRAKDTAEMTLICKSSSDCDVRDGIVRQSQLPEGTFQSKAPDVPADRATDPSPERRGNMHGMNACVHSQFRQRHRLLGRIMQPAENLRQPDWTSDLLARPDLRAHQYLDHQSLDGERRGGVIDARLSPYVTKQRRHQAAGELRRLRYRTFAADELHCLRSDLDDEVRGSTGAIAVGVFHAARHHHHGLFFTWEALAADPLLQRSMADLIDQQVLVKMLRENKVRRIPAVNDSESADSRFVTYRGREQGPHRLSLDHG